MYAMFKTLELFNKGLLRLNQLYMPKNNMERKLRLKIHGLVQGVGFRLFAKQGAEELGIKGWAENRPDGSIEMEVQGRKRDLAEFLKLCQIGPNLARVEGIEVEWLGVDQDEGSEGFQIRF